MIELQTSFNKSNNTKNNKVIAITPKSKLKCYVYIVRNEYTSLSAILVKSFIIRHILKCGLKKLSNKNILKLCLKFEK